jgi:hypothetical protein
MKLRSLVGAAAVLLALVGTLYWSQHKKPSDDVAKMSASADTPAILKLDEAAISSIELKGKNAAPIVLTKGDNGAWKITQPSPFRADEGAVNSVLSTLSSLNSERVVEDKASDLKQYGLVPAVLEVDITEKNNKTHQLLIGDDTPAGSAVYAAIAGDPRVFTVAGYKKNSIAQTLDDLRDKHLLTVSADKVNRIELITKNQEIEFERNKDEWQILKPKPSRADSVEVGELVGKLADARMNLAANDDEAKKIPGDFARATPVVTAKITDPSGTEELQVRKNGDTYYAKSSVTDGAYKVDASLGQTLDKKLDDFRNKKLFDFGYNEPAKIELHNGSKGFFLTKGGADWWSDGKKIDSASAQTVISDLRNLSASKFVDTGFANPAIEIAITSDDGKRIEKVSIAKSGDGFIAKRDNEPTLYFVEPGSVNALEKAADEIKPAAVH